LKFRLGLLIVLKPQSMPKMWARAENFEFSHIVLHSTNQRRKVITHWQRSTSNYYYGGVELVNSTLDIVKMQQEWMVFIIYLFSFTVL
jgi:hypothetical protein